MTNLELAVVVPAYNEAKTITSTLDALYAQTNRDFLPIVVDNGSTDATRSILGDYQLNHPGFPLRVVEEEKKGTGFACNAGFEAAISAGSSIIARTDADTQPRKDWTDTITGHFKQDDNLRLLSGPSRALQNEWYRTGDRFLWPASVFCARLLFSAKWRSLSGMRLAIGHNSSTTADTYQAVGGFPNTSIAETDEDLAYSRAVGESFGVDTMAIESDVVVYTSMRRLRKIGYHSSFIYYGLNPGPAYREKASGGTVDIR